MTEALLNQLYSNSKYGVAFQPANIIYKKALEFNPHILRKTVVDFVRSKLSYIQYAKKVKKFQKRKIWSLFPGKNLSVDLLEFNNIQKRQNRPYNFLFCSVDIFSGFLQIVPLKNKSINEVLLALKRCFQLDSPISLLCDKESALHSKEIQTFLREKGCNLILQKGAPHLKTKNGVVESAQRYLKRIIARFCDEHKIKRFVNYLHHIQDIFNNHINRNSGQKPVALRFNKDLIASHQEKITRELEESKNQMNDSKILKIGTYVHVRLLDPSIFSKETEKKFSKQIYMIVEVKKTMPVTYRVYPVVYKQDRYFYRQEIIPLSENANYNQKISFASPIEKILNKRELRNKNIYECSFIGLEKKGWLTADQIRDRFILFQNNFSREILNNRSD